RKCTDTAIAGGLSWPDRWSPRARSHDPLSLVDHPTTNDGHLDRGVLDAFYGAGEDVVCQDHQVGELTDLDRAAAVFLKNGARVVEGPHPQRLRGRDALAR